MRDYLLVSWPLIGSWRDPYQDLFDGFRAEGRRFAEALREKRLAEEQDRAEWIDSVRRRLGLVAAVHRCRVRQCRCGEWKWDCLRPRCWSGDHCGSHGNALASALAHARAFLPEPPGREEELPGELAWDGYVVLLDRAGARLNPAGRARGRE